MSKIKDPAASWALGFYAKHCEAMDEFAGVGDPDDNSDLEQWRSALSKQVGDTLADVFVEHREHIETVFHRAADDAIWILKEVKSRFPAVLKGLGVALASDRVMVSRDYWQMTAQIRLQRPGRRDGSVIRFRVFIATLNRSLCIGMTLLLNGKRKVIENATTVLRNTFDLPSSFDQDLQHGELLLWSRPLLTSVASHRIDPVDLRSVVDAVDCAMGKVDGRLFKIAFEAIKAKP